MAKFVVCLSVLLLLVVLSESKPMKSCCTQYHESPIPFKALQHYTVQDEKQNCNIKAIIFTTKKNRLVCANPDREWVQYAIGSLPKNP
ncbi:C-C motif chemokine 20 [Mastacembelus armatus]|uniref:C-C motif chemokine 20 n=1 Tax=Mastacembelus armatus TaxID=205130 RepID=UPI000E457C0A|nr:C-C motif chemokine 20-like [Mastacembelus armatus]